MGSHWQQWLRHKQRQTKEKPVDYCFTLSLVKGYQNCPSQGQQLNLQPNERFVLSNLQRCEKHFSRSKTSMGSFFPLLKDFTRKYSESRLHYWAKSCRSVKYVHLAKKRLRSSKINWLIKFNQHLGARYMVSGTPDNPPLRQRYRAFIYVKT